MAGAIPFPDGLRLVRTTPEYDEGTVPTGLLAAHRVASGVWGRLVVRTGALRFVFEEGPDEGRVVEAGETQTIPPDVSHHIVTIGPVRFAVEFHRGDDEQPDTVTA